MMPPHPQHRLSYRPRRLRRAAAVEGLLPATAEVLLLAAGLVVVYSALALALAGTLSMFARLLFGWVEVS
jgi:hypothetical protein